MVFKWQMKTYDGPWCRDCGKAIYRTAMNHTLLAGWWGVISFFANLFFIGQNLVALAKLRGLGEPQRAPGQAFLPPGKPLYQRPGIFVGLLVVTVVGFFGIGYLSADTPEEALEKLPGKCVTFKAADAGQRRISDTVDCSQPHDGKILGIRDGDVNDFLGGGPSLDRCPAGTTTIFTLKNEDSLVGKYICVNEDG